LQRLTSRDGLLVAGWVIHAWIPQWHSRCIRESSAHSHKETVDRIWCSGCERTRRQAASSSAADRYDHGRISPQHAARNKVPRKNPL